MEKVTVKNGAGGWSQWRLEVPEKGEERRGPSKTTAVTWTVGFSAPSASLLIDITKLSGAADMLEEQDVIQMDLDKLQKWAHVNLMRFNKAKSKILHMGRGKPWYQYRQGDEGVDSSPVEKDLGVLVDEKLNMSRQCILGRIKRSMTSRLREVILLLW
ncbi:cAMP-dependent protein kinase inhibitor alpha [Grus japonensis]|uniref:cAMP-dependent protein kinase inhibitor alpha n=1 Tax=Grus japonensis TaxID=30415 RepID=A0ABC9Y1K3_GRUJA